jgi:transposase
VLSEVSCRVELHSVHIPSERARAWREIATARDSLVRAKTALTNNLKSQLRGKLLLLQRRSSGQTPAQIRKTWTELQGSVPAHVERLVRVAELLHLEIRNADKQVLEQVKSEPICRQLMTAPGIGPMTSFRYVATIDDVSRFATAHAVQAYLGLTPGENSSSSRVRRTGLTKAGPPQMRWLLVQAAWTARRTRPNDPMVRWAEQIAERRGDKIATVALARKLAGILFAMWRDKSNYNPLEGSR